jgi:hypothetical protein
VSHGYSIHGSEESQGNVVMHHHYDISKSKQMSFRVMGDNIASSIWQQLDKFENEVKKLYPILENQFYPMNCMPIDLDGYTIQVHQMHISKNSYIKPHIDVSNLETSFISWFAKGNPNGECFGMFQQYLNFDNNNGVGIFVLRKIYYPWNIEV